MEKRFSAEDLQRINQAVAAAETQTAAEIVPVVAAVSGRYDRPEDIAGLWLGVSALVVAWLFWPRPAAEPGSWEGPGPALEITALTAALLGGFLAGTVLAAQVGWLRRLFTPHQQMAAEVAERARAAFFDSRVHHTAAGTGLLIYVSLFERMAHVLADRAVEEKLGATALQQVCASLTDRLRQGGPVDALCATIQECGARLAAVLPQENSAANQLPNAVVLIG